MRGMMMLKALVLAAVALMATAVGASAASLTLQDVKGPPSTAFTATAAGFTPGETVTFAFAPDTGRTAVADGGGSATTTLTATASTLPGKYPVVVTGATSRATASAAFLVRTNWAQARFTEKRAGVNVFENVLNPSNVGSLTQAFDLPCGAGGDHRTPTVASGRAYVASADGHLCAYNKASGRALWDVDLRADTGAPPAAAYTKLYVSAGQSLVTLDSVTGRKLWTGDTYGRTLQAAPAAYKNMIYVGSKDGFLYAYDANGCGDRRCFPLWRGRVGRRVLAAPTAWGHYLFVTAGDGSISKFDANGCGRQVCEALARTPSGRSWPTTMRTSVAVIGQTLFAGFGDGRVATLRTTDLGVITQTRLMGRPRVSSPAVTGDAVYVTTSNGDLVALARGTLAPVWSARLKGGATPAGFANGPAVANGVVYVGNGKGGTQAFATAGCGRASCGALWSDDRHGAGSPVISDGRVYTGSWTGVAAFGLPF
jgi:outer membrane protein assembly factor BamB